MTADGPGGPKNGAEPSSRGGVPAHGDAHRASRNEPRLPLPTEPTAGTELAREYAAAREREGRVMAILRAMGPRVEVLRGFLALADAVLYGPAVLGHRERELLGWATSQANGAEYSAGIHADLLDRRGGGPDGSDRDRALVAFARRLTLTPTEAGEAVDDLREHLSADEVYDAIAVVALLNFANRVALATRISSADDLDEQPQSSASEKRPTAGS
ncbi:MAG TPA: carboxymuconolactone decarboxylase family protein [Jiangellaceae bacterium]|nr:carboxymuconolactone decarboxylase family protein [Jiangellaceae bacterium]